MALHANDLLVRQIQDEITAIVAADGGGTPGAPATDQLVLLLRAAPLSLLKLHRRDLADGMTDLPLAVLTTVPRILGADAVGEDRKEFWHSLAEQLYAERTGAQDDPDPAFG